MARDPTVRSKGYLSNKTARTGRHSGGIALLLSFAIFGLLWILHIPLRGIYVPNEDDISTLASSLLLAPGAHWQDWFTRGYSHFFDLYPDWPAHGTEFARTAFTRPAFQFVIYLTHFVLGRDWASYQLINCFAVAGMGGVAFQIAQSVLGLRTGPSLVAAMLVVLSPSLWLSWVSAVVFAIEPLATVLVDISTLADGLLLAPGARWQDWFTRGYSHFCDLYPDWPAHGTEATARLLPDLLFSS